MIHAHIADEQLARIFNDPAAAGIEEPKRRIDTGEWLRSRIASLPDDSDAGEFVYLVVGGIVALTLIVVCFYAGWMQ